MGNFPNMKDAYAEWLNPLTFKIVTKTVSNHQVVETTQTIILQGVIYPQTAQQISHKPEGQRRWKWWSLITDYELNVDDIVVDAESVKYRVDRKKNFGSAGFYEYELAQDWT